MLPLSIVEGEAFHEASGSAIKVLLRICIEHVRQYGRANGRLIVTYKDFEAYGVRAEAVAKALPFWEAAGILQIQHGGWKPGKGKVPNFYTLPHCAPNNQSTDSSKNRLRKSKSTRLRKSKCSKNGSASKIEAETGFENRRPSIHLSVGNGDGEENGR